jgi:WD40 repeat protein
VLHRDLKPANVLIDEFDEPRITDFGLAKRLTSDSSLATGHLSLTLTGQVIGSPNFMPPEQGAGKCAQVGPASDIYGLGALLYYLLTARPPFVAETFEATLDQVLNTDPAAPRQLNPSIPLDLETLCLKCLEKDPARRYASAGELADELDRFLKGEPIRARPIGIVGKTWRWCRRKPALAGMTAAVATLLLTVTVVSTVAAIRITASRRTEERESYYSLISLAQSLVEQGEIDQAKEALLKCPPRFRHWEWGHLLFRCHQDVLSIPAHTDIKFDPMLLWSDSVTLVQNVIFNHDGSQLASLGRDGSVKVWDAKDGHRIFALGDTNRPATAIGFNPSSGQLATVFSDGAVEVWDTGTRQKRWDSRFGAEEVERLAYRPDGNGLGLCGRMEVWVCDAATGAVVGHQRMETPVTSMTFVSSGSRLLVRTEREARLFDADGKTNLGILSVPSISGEALFISPTADRSVTISPSGMVSLWSSLATRTELGEIRGAQPSMVRQIFFSNDGRRFCTGGESSTARVWDAESGKELVAIPSKVYRAVFSPDGKRLAAIGSDKIARVWDLERRSELLQLRGHSSSIETVAFSRDGSRMATGAHDGIVKLWSTGTGREVLQESTWPWGLSVSPDGRRILDAGDEFSFTIRDAESGQRLVTVDTRVHEVVASAFSPDGQRVATVGGDGLGRVWDAHNGRLLLNLEGHTRNILSVAYAPTGEWIATAGPDGTARIWDASTGRQIHCFSHGSNLIFQVAFSPDSRRLATASEQGLRVWDAASGRLLIQASNNVSGLRRVVFSPDGRYLVIAYDLEPALRICDAWTGKPLATWPTGVAGPLAFSGDGKRLLVSGSGRDIMYGSGEAYAELWDFESGRRILTLRGHSEPLNRVAFAANDRRIVSSSSDMTVRQWETFPWRQTEYPAPVHDPFLERARRFADEYWRKRLAAEAQPVVPTRSRPDNTVLWPKRDARATSAQLDLTELYNGVLHAAFHPVFSLPEYDNYLRGLGSGVLELEGMQFDVRGVIQLRRHTDLEGAWRYCWELLPTRLEGIRVQQKIRRLHVVHGTACTESSENEGAEVARFVWHYDTGEEASLILYGQDIRDWWWRPEKPDVPTSDRSRVVWTGSNPIARDKGYSLRLYLTTLENPRPQEVVRSLDYVSAMSESAPFLIALTVE